MEKLLSPPIVALRPQSLLRASRPWPEGKTAGDLAWADILATVINDPRLIWPWAAILRYVVEEINHEFLDVSQRESLRRLVALGAERSTPDVHGVSWLLSLTPHEVRNRWPMCVVGAARALEAAYRPPNLTPPRG